MSTLYLATRNAHKAQELRALLGPVMSYVTLSELPGAPELVEDAPTFAGNATRKATQLARWLSTQWLTPKEQPHGWVLADDSGLEVDALQGAPGVHSARFAAREAPVLANSPDAENTAKLLRLLADTPEARRSARFRCCLALTPLFKPSPGGASPVCSMDEFEFRTELFEGVCEGRIGFTPRGQGGFGYDPVFLPEGFEQTFAELGEGIKNQISHRSRALAKLKPRLIGSLIKS